MSSASITPTAKGGFGRKTERHISPSVDKFGLNSMLHCNTADRAARLVFEPTGAEPLTARGWSACEGHSGLGKEKPLAGVVVVE